MSATTIATVTKMLDTLPENAQERVVDHLCEYIEDLRDELDWDDSFAKTQSQLMEAARQARREIAEGKAQPMDYEQL